MRYGASEREKGEGGRANPVEFTARPLAAAYPPFWPPGPWESGAFTARPRLEYKRAPVRTSTAATRARRPVAT